MVATVRKVAERLELAVVAGSEHIDTEVTGGYASDLLSCVMASARKGNIWVTLQSHPNVVAVAVLLELAAVIIAEGRGIEAATIERADAEGVPILTTPDDTFATVVRLAGLGVESVDQQ